uniref:Uncharacterized protein n=1 Tax=Oryza glumipatula TaxID=40148 RepID=A0A0D9ZQ59_9ORYZ
MSSRMAGSAILRHVGGVRLFTASATSPAAAAAAARPFLAGGEAVPGVWGLRLMSTSSVASTEAAAKAEAKKADAEKEVVVNSYWGIEQSKKLVREDGTEWKWSCFRPWETYTADTSIDLTKHHVPKTLLDKIAYWTVKSLRFPTDIFFQRRYGCRAMMLETSQSAAFSFADMYTLHLQRPAVTLYPLRNPAPPPPRRWCRSPLCPLPVSAATAGSRLAYIPRASAAANPHPDPQDEPEPQPKGGFWARWMAESAEMRAKVAKLGLAAVLAYGLFDAVTYTTFFVLAFLGYEKSTGKNPAANLKALLGIVILMWTGNNVTRPFRVAGAAALAPAIDKGLKGIQEKLNLPSQMYAFALVVGSVAADSLEALR